MGLREEAKRLQNFYNYASDKRVLLYQIGKVGSTAISQALEDVGFWVLHVHSLDTGAQADFYIDYEMKGMQIPPSIEYGLILGKSLDAIKGTLNVITLVRDPIARDLSAFFQDQLRTETGEKLISSGDLDAVKEEYVKRNTLGHTLSWFDKEISKYLKIDVYDTPFTAERGYQHYSHNNVRLLLIRHETDTNMKAQALSQWLNVRTINIKKANVSSEKFHGNIYRRFLNWVVLPETLVQSTVESKLTRHFFSTEERDEMFVRWTHGLASLKL